ncbi:MAG: hypothetical protein CVU54_01985 [Deltaproteobacteria bacterium HGW-Deltaproteobacteria-12]|jgi:hypothetical protein|nr:MAG: hypothetical protein CVU54_01985 [Deltaproteobacteria bacterium HGW-Deltaproteobacteria-12]
MSDANILKKIGDAIVDYAPALAGVLTVTGAGAPTGAALAVISSLGKAFGLGSNASPDDIHAAIISDPQIALKARIADQDFCLKQREQDIEELRIKLADTQNARGREMSVKDNVNKILAFSIVGAFIALVGATLLGYAKVESALAGTLVGYLSAKCEQILAYYFGSSKGSDKKTDLLAKATPIKE